MLQTEHEHENDTSALCFRVQPALPSPSTRTHTHAHAHASHVTHFFLTHGTLLPLLQHTSDTLVTKHVTTTEDTHAVGTTTTGTEHGMV